MTLQDGTDSASSTATTLTTILKSNDFSTEEVQKVLASIEAVTATIQKYDGKVQRYLRKYGQMMVEEMVEAAPQFPSVDVATFRTQGGREWHGCSGARPIGLRRASGGAYRAARTRSRPVTSRTVRAFEATGTG